MKEKSIQLTPVGRTPDHTIYSVRPAWRPSNSGQGHHACPTQTDGIDASILIMTKYAVRKRNRNCTPWNLGLTDNLVFYGNCDSARQTNTVPCSKLHFRGAVRNTLFAGDDISVGVQTQGDCTALGHSVSAQPQYSPVIQTLNLGSRGYGNAAVIFCGHP